MSEKSQTSSLCHKLALVNAIYNLKSNHFLVTLKQNNFFNVVEFEMIAFFHVTLILDALFIFRNDQEVKVMAILVQGMIVSLKGPSERIQNY